MPKFRKIEREYIVTGISEDPPQNSSIKYKFLTNFNNADIIYGYKLSEAWGARSTQNFVILESEELLGNIENRLSSFTHQYYVEWMDQLKSNEKYKNVEDPIKVGLRNLNDFYLYGSVTRPGKINNSYLLGIIGISILIIAIISIRPSTII